MKLVLMQNTEELRVEAEVFSEEVPSLEVVETSEKVNIEAVVETVGQR